MLERSIFGICIYCLFISATIVSAAPESWPSKMRELSQALSDIVPDLFSAETSPQQAADLKRKAAAIYSITKQLENGTPHAVKAPDADPALPYIAQTFNDSIARANESLREGHLEYAKAELRTSVAYCIACHTRSQTGPEFPLLASFAKPMENANWIDKLSFQAATRQFESVYSGVTAQLKTGLSQGVTPFDLEKGVRIALAISIRVKKDPSKSIELANAVLSSPYASEGLKRDAKAWMADLKNWQSETTNYKTAKEMLQKARALVGETKEWVPHSEVRYLRASVLMHDLLREFPSSPEVAEAFYITGLSYDRLHDLGPWSLHEMYFEACVKRTPHSQLAERCYRNLAESVTFGFTGSRGTEIPKEVAADLKRLRELAAVNNSTKKQQR